MYNSNNNRSSIRTGGYRKFNGPRTGGGFNKPRSFQNAPRKTRTISSDPSQFIKKANPNMESTEYSATHKFGDFDLVAPLLQNILSKGYDTPTPIQDQAIQPILDGRDVIGLASTGTGKTAAFLIPLINKLYKDQNQKVLIVVPTRELAAQIMDEFKFLTRDMRLFCTQVIGGASMNRQVFDLRRNPHVVIGTPGRLKDLVMRKIIYLQDFSHIVLDEVDLMVDIGFINDIKFFVSMLPPERQSLFFSATISPKIDGVLRSFVKDPVTVSVKKQTTSENVDQDVVRVSGTQKKIEVLHDLLIKEECKKVLIFGRTKHGIDKLHKDLETRGFKLGAIHGNKSQSQRQRVLDSFKSDHIKILLATDVASRGLDIPNVSHVINYELPETYEDYVHRIGRTGRAGKTGIALTFLS